MLTEKEALKAADCRAKNAHSLPTGVHMFDDVPIGCNHILELDPREGLSNSYQSILPYQVKANKQRLSSKTPPLALEGLPFQV